MDSRVDPWWPYRPGGGLGHLIPTAFPLDQHQLHGQLLGRLGQPGDLGPGQLQFVVLFAGLHPGLGLGQRGLLIAGVPATRRGELLVASEADDAQPAHTGA